MNYNAFQNNHCRLVLVHIVVHQEEADIDLRMHHIEYGHIS